MITMMMTLMKRKMIVEKTVPVIKRLQIETIPLFKRENVPI